MHKENSLKISESRQSFGLTSRGRTAFTLPEMLVSVGLMLLVMSLFAEIFSLAVTAMTTQIGLAKNDQRARTAFVVIDNDLKRISYRPINDHRGIVPLVPGLKFNGEDASPAQAGYIYYSENNPADETDDVLQFTIYGGQKNNRYPEQNLDYYGRAGLLTPAGARHQPDWDDGTPGDNVSVSKQAEIVYFLRNGTLYRRVVLLRDANSIPNNLQDFVQSNNQKLAQPAHVTGGDPIDLMRPPSGSNPLPGYTGNFYSNFDYSAHFGNSPYDSDLSTPPGSPNRVAVFHGSLSNSATDNWPLGVPNFRFGFYHSIGRPREFITDGTNSFFMGRFTHEETSNTNFGYPQYIPANNPFSRDDYNVNTFLATGRLDLYANGSRRGADILMNNVQSFDVEIWDERANGGVGGFVDIGASGGDFSTTNNLNGGFGSTNNSSGSVYYRNVFDTWHSLDSTQLNLLNVGVIGTGQAPYVPKVINPSTVGAWAANTTYAFGDLVRPAVPGLINNALLYRCRTPGISGGTDPFTNPDAVGDPIPDGAVIWEVVDNRRPIKALRIIIRFHDPNSDQMRQMTMVHSFNEDLE